MGEHFATTAFQSKLSTDAKILDLPGDTDPVHMLRLFPSTDAESPMRGFVAVTLNLGADCYIAYSDDKTLQQAAADVLLNSDTSRFPLAAGILEIDINGNSAYILIKSQAAAVVRGLGILFHEGV